MENGLMANNMEGASIQMNKELRGRLFGLMEKKNNGLIDNYYQIQFIYFLFTKLFYSNILD